MLEDVYNSHILELAGNIGHLGSLDNPDATAKAHSRLCGSMLTVDIKTENGFITEFAQDVKACALGQASSSAVSRVIIGASFDEIHEAAAQLRAMLKENGPAPSGRFEALKWLQPVKDFKARHASTLLIFDALEDAISQIEQQSSQQIEAVQV